MKELTLLMAQRASRQGKGELVTMTTPSVPWGTITLVLDNEAFRQGFLEARHWYFGDIYGEGGYPPEEPQWAIQLRSEELLGLIILPDEHGHYHFDAMAQECLPEYLGYLVGYLSGPLAPSEAEHYLRYLQRDE